VSKINLSRFSKAVGEKTTLAATSELIKEAITHQDWKVRVGGYFFLGFLAESCKESFSQNLDEIMKIAASGVVDSHPRVRFAGIACLGLMLSEQAPEAQKKYHAEILPELIKLMNNESYLKLKTQATAAAINFVWELIVVDEKNIEDVKKESSIMETYTNDLLTTCSTLLNESL